MPAIKVKEHARKLFDKISFFFTEAMNYISPNDFEILLRAVPVDPLIFRYS